MAGQFLQAWTVDATTFSGVIGSGDHSLVPRACGCALAEDMREDIEELEAELTDLVDGVSESPAWTTRRCMALVADTWGTRVDTGLSLPGRGWQDLAPAWAHWGAPAIATLWTHEPAWAKRPPLAGEWPRIMWAPAGALAALAEETARFDKAIVMKAGVPSSVPRFGEGDWEMGELTPYIEAIVAELDQLVKAARRAERALAIWLDGSQ